MKKLTPLLLTLVLLASSLLLVGCSNSIDTSVYFNSIVSAKVYGSNTTQKLNLSDLSNKSPSTTKKYLSFEFKANKDWIFGMYIETISFYIYSTESMTDVEFDFSLTGTENGQVTLTSATKTFSLTNQPYSFTKNSSRKITIKINDTITLSTSDPVFTVKLSDTYNDPKFEYTIHSFEVVGYHQ